MILRTPSFILLLVVGLGASLLRAQPSGGPYGPQPQTYEIPAGAGRVYYVAPDGKPEAAGDFHL